MSIIDQIETAIQVHCAWADRLQSAILTGASDMTVEQALRHDACAFGQWLCGDSIPESAKSVHGYGNALQIHEEFHKCAGDVLALALSGQREEAIRQMDNTSQYLMTSVMLTLTLRAWQIDLGGEAGITAAASP